MEKISGRLGNENVSTVIECGRCRGQEFRVSFMPVPLVQEGFAGFRFALLHDKGSRVVCGCLRGIAWSAWAAGCLPWRLRRGRSLGWSVRGTSRKFSCWGARLCRRISGEEVS